MGFYCISADSDVNELRLCSIVSRLTALLIATSKSSIH